MTDRWKCPHCGAIFRKSEGHEAMDQVASRATLGLTSGIHCPACKKGLDPGETFSGGYDMPELPTGRELSDEVSHLMMRFTFECRQLGIEEKEAQLEFICDRVGEVLFERYGLDQAEIISTMSRAFSSGGG